MRWERVIYWLLCAGFAGMCGWLASRQVPAPFLVAFTVLAGWPLVRTAYLHGSQDARAGASGIAARSDTTQGGVAVRQEPAPKGTPNTPP